MQNIIPVILTHNCYRYNETTDTFEARSWYCCFSVGVKAYHHSPNILLTVLLSWLGWHWCTRARCRLLKIMNAFMGRRMCSLPWKLKLLVFYLISTIIWTRSMWLIGLVEGVNVCYWISKRWFDSRPTKLFANLLVFACCCNVADITFTALHDASQLRMTSLGHQTPSKWKNKAIGSPNLAFLGLRISLSVRPGRDRCLAECPSSAWWLGPGPSSNDIISEDWEVGERRKSSSWRWWSGGMALGREL